VGSLVSVDEAVEELQDLETGVVFPALPAVVAIPIAYDSLFRDFEKGGVVRQKPSVAMSIQITQIGLYDTENLDHIFSNKLHDKGRNPVVMTADDPCQMFFANEATVMPCQ
jgi:hypothetical protein